MSSMDIDIIVPLFQTFCLPLFLFHRQYRTIKCVWYEYKNEFRAKYEINSFKAFSIILDILVLKCYHYELFE